MRYSIILMICFTSCLPITREKPTEGSALVPSSQMPQDAPKSAPSDRTSEVIIPPAFTAETPKEPTLKEVPPVIGLKPAKFASCSLIGALEMALCKDGAALDGDCEPNPYDRSLCIKKGTSVDWLKKKSCKDIKEPAQCPSTTDKNQVAIAGEGATRQVCRSADDLKQICEEAKPHNWKVKGCFSVDLVVVYNVLYVPCYPINDQKSCAGDAVISDPVTAGAAEKLCTWRSSKDDPTFKCRLIDDAKAVHKLTSFVCDVKNGHIKKEWIQNAAGDGLEEAYTHNSCSKGMLNARAPYNAKGDVFSLNAACKAIPFTK